jgi:hypothetical protein
MRGVLTILPILIATSARADGHAVKLTIGSMTAADDINVCSLLRSDTKDGCKRVSRRSEPGFDAEVFQAGTKRGIHRYVLVVTTGDQRMVSPSIDLLGESCDDGGCVTLDAATPTVKDVSIDGKPGVVLDVVAKWTADAKFQTESLVGCAPAAGSWKCSSADFGRCEATVGPDGAVATSCGASGSLTFAP